VESSTYSKIEASIGFSRKWNAREAGREVARSAISKLSTPPSFFLLFSTIHYKDRGGFREFLDGVWDVLPEGTPLIGGTFAGFINNYGCFSRGATALAVSYPNLDVAVGLGRHVKLSPKNAGKQCAKTIQKQLGDSIYKNKFLINVISGPKIPNLPDTPFLKEINVVKSKVMGTIFTRLVVHVLPFFGWGVGKEDCLLEILGKELNDYCFIGGDSDDDGKFYSEFQFLNKEIHSNSIVALACNIDIPIFMNSNVGLHPTDQKFTVSKSTFNNRIITEIENKSAKDYFFKTIIGLNVDQVKELAAFYYKFAYYFPITFDKDPKTTSGIAGFFGDNIHIEHSMIGKDVRILSVTGREILENINNTFDFNLENIPFMFMFSSAINSFVLRSKTYEIKNILDKKFGDKPYLMVMPMLENSKFFNEHPRMLVYSLNALSLECNRGENDIYKWT
jgi:hypothetical protein